MFKLLAFVTGCVVAYFTAFVIALKGSKFRAAVQSNSTD